MPKQQVLHRNAEVGDQALHCYAEVAGATL
jgi:hypothetical protein